MDNDKKPWERQRDETDRAWAAFQIYRNLPPSERSYDAAYRERYAKEPHIRATKTFRAWTKKYNWSERASAWDCHLDDQERAATEQQRVEWREDRRELLRDFLTNVGTAMEKFDPANVSVGQLTQAVQMVVQEMRAEMDDLPTEKRQIGGDLSVVIKDKIETALDKIYGDKQSSKDIKI